MKDRYRKYLTTLFLIFGIAFFLLISKSSAQAGTIQIDSFVIFEAEAPLFGLGSSGQPGPQVFPEGVPIEIFNENFGPDEYLGIAETDALGIIKKSIFSLEPHPDLYFRIIFNTSLAKVVKPGGLLARVYDVLPAIPDVTSPFTENILVPIGKPEDPNASAFILKIVDVTDKWFKSNASNYSSRPKVKIEQDNEAVGTAFFENRNGLWEFIFYDRLYLGGYCRWIPETITHEHAHAIMADVYNNQMPAGAGPNPPGDGSHVLYSESSPGFAFSEGWAEFMSGAVFNDQTPDIKLKASVTEVPSLDYETNEWWKGEDKDGTNNSGQVVEGAVASVFWDLFDEVVFMRRTFQEEPGGELVLEVYRPNGSQVRSREFAIIRV